MKAPTMPNWQTYNISPDETCHLIEGQPAYENRFIQVLKFHPPGIAPVLDHTGAYHIDPMGQPIYPSRYTRSFGFYCKRAAVNDDGQWFHILPNGDPLYKNRYKWCGNFQENLCSVSDRSNLFFHIDLSGNRVYAQSYPYVGDFHDGAAVVQTPEGLHTHIDPKGKPIHPRQFLDLDVFHKGFARAKDPQGWFHIDRSGEPLYQERYAIVEPFYNGVSRVETVEGELLLIDENGKARQTIRAATEDPFHKVSGDLVSYWKLFTLKTAQDLKIFDSLPHTLPTLAKKIGLTVAMTENILLGLKEMGYVDQSKNHWHLTPTGTFLSSTHPYSLKKAQNLWMEEHFDSWHDLRFSLEKGACAFEKKYKMEWFDFLSHHPKKQTLYHQALSHYAKRDYAALGNKIDFSPHRSIADIGGSTGTVLDILMNTFPHLEGHLLDLPAVISQIKLPDQIKDKVFLHPCDFFKPWPALQVDSAILCRVIHDWPNKAAEHILKETHRLLRDGSSRLYVIENSLDKTSGSGALLNLNMLVMTGGQERTVDGFRSLFERSGFSMKSQIPLNAVSSIFVLKPLK